MSAVARDAGQVLDPRVGELVAAWLPGRRWFPGRAGVRAEPWLAVTFGDAPVGGTGLDERRAGVVLLLVRLTGAGLPGGATVVQVPLVLTPLAGRGPGLIDVVRTAAGEVAVHDGGAHPACWLAVLRAIGVGSGVPDEVLVAGGHVVAGEQSNTSVALPGAPSAAGRGGMLKLLRSVAPGPHPDVVVPQALTRAGWDGVPRFLGSLDVALAEPAEPAGAPTVLAVLAELVPDARDGFELACEHAGRDESFAHQAGDLARVVAELHTVLRRTTAPGPRLVPHTFVAALRHRAATAEAEVPALAARAGAVDALLDDLERRLPAVPLQAVHGDLHLGQALHGDTGWKLLDFEGEPLRPLAERNAPDLPLRDVAGLLRSFGYAAAVGGASDPARWEAEAAHAFLAGYQATATEMAGASGMDPHTTDVVLRALVLDKALYEVVYETRQRPHWVHIPLAAVDRVLDSGPGRP